MKKYNPNIHHRRSIRLKGYDYSQAGLYYITLDVQDRVHLFGEIKDEEMILNPYGKIANEEWLKTPEIRKNCSLGEFIVMPDHFHAIISIDYQIENNNHPGKFISPSQTIGAIVRGFKGAVTNRIKEYYLEQIKNRNKGKDSMGDRIDDFLRDKVARVKSIWQRDYWEHIIRSEKEYRNISRYIINNPKNWGKDKLSKK